ncbi:MAG TPA: DHA2 family efflux MFS transporter permease subunit [Candidatus Saccharimonadales bacterium]|nr:DHA2 family efflux MFS transporter permease subunit [Candidatus Saccharimonadales bacterium]
MKTTESLPLVNPWIITIAVMLATFMEVLDTTVVNVSIPHIAGNLSATYEEGTWVVTSYLVANAIILPMAGWLATYFGRRRMLLACVAGFSIASLLCGMATSLPQLIIFRVLQGLAGGGLQPLAQAILLETFPKEKHGQAMAAFGLGIIVAPIVGPTLGGWITDNYTWRWIFYLNIPVGVFSLIMMTRYVHDPSYIKRKNDASVDLWGIGLLALGLGALQILLDTGQRKDWLGSRDIRIEAFLCIAGLLAFVIREMTVENPIVDLRALKDRSFGVGVLLMSAVGFCLYASLVLLPQYLETLLNYPSMQAGLALSPRGLGSFALTFVVGAIASRVDVRKLLIIGFLVGAVTMFMFSGLNLNAGYWDIFWPQAVQGGAVACIFIPLSAAAMSHVPREKMGNATSIFNLMRNIGGSVGIAMMTTLLARRQQMHQSRLIEHIRSGQPHVSAQLHQFTQFFVLKGYDPVTASRQAYGAMLGQVQQHAAMLSFVEAFKVMGLVFLAMIPLIVLLKDPKKNGVQKGVSAASHTRIEETQPELLLHA